MGFRDPKVSGDIYEPWTLLQQRCSRWSFPGKAVQRSIRSCHLRADERLWQCGVNAITAGVWQWPVPVSGTCRWGWARLPSGALHSSLVLSLSSIWRTATPELARGTCLPYVLDCSVPRNSGLLPLLRILAAPGQQGQEDSSSFIYSLNNDAFSALICQATVLAAGVSSGDLRWYEARDPALWNITVYLWVLLCVCGSLDM